MQTPEQIWSNEGKKCSGTIVSPYWVATSESCCDGAKLATFTLSDWRDTATGSETTAQSSVSMSDVYGNPPMGRKRRTTFDETKIPFRGQR